jgi:hypothetical protein
MSDRSLFVYGVTQSRFNRLRELMSDASLPLIFRLNCELTIHEQLISPIDNALPDQTEAGERELLLLRDTQVPLVPRLRELWQRNLGDEPTFVMITGSNREWRGIELLERIDREMTLIDEYKLKNCGKVVHT